MTKLPLLLMIVSCVDAPTTETVTKEGKIDEPPVLVDAGLKGEYLLRGHGMSGGGGGNWHVGAVGTLSVSGASAAITYFHTFSAIRTDGRLTRQEACIVTLGPLPRFGQIKCTLDRDDRREELVLDYATSADGNRAALEGGVFLYRLTALASGELYYNNYESSPMSFEAAR